MASLYQAIFARLHLLWPILMGLGAAYILSAAVYSSKALDTQPELEKDSLDSKQSQSPQWTGIILEKNILDMEVPEQKNPASSSQAEADIDSWQLLGTFTGPRNLALVSVQGKKQLLSPGQSTQGWELTSVRPRSTLWQSGAKTKNLQMWAEEAKSQSNTNQNIRQSAKSSKSTKVSLSREKVQPLLQNPNALMQMAQFKPHTRQGSVQGFQISNIQPGSLLQQLGLQPKDILTRIDGQSISGPADLLQAYSSLKQSSLVSLDIIRQGQNRSLLIEITN